MEFDKKKFSKFYWKSDIKILWIKIILNLMKNGLKFDKQLIWNCIKKLIYISLKINENGMKIIKCNFIKFLNWNFIQKIFMKLDKIQKRNLIKRIFLECDKKL